MSDTGEGGEGPLPYLPLFHDLRDRSVLVVGGGTVALRKVRLLHRAGARVTVVAPVLAPELEDMARAGAIDYRLRHFRPVDAAGKAVVVAATGEHHVNAEVAAVGERLNIPVNAVDDPDAGTAIMPALVERSPVVAAVSSGGAAPVLARRIRAKLERELPPGLGRLAELARAFRSRVAERIPGSGVRRRFWERALSGPAAHAALDGRMREAELTMEAEMEADCGRGRAVGAVYLVGAGPGDPELLTLKAARLMEECDVVLHDRLIPPAILDRVRRDAEFISVGKGPGCHTMSQEAIHDLLIERARVGQRVLRLKGGDPMVFGRGGEEVEALANAGVRYRVVPGITAATGCAAAAGIPLTHRQHATSCMLATGHSCQEGGEPEWADLARPDRTAVFYMGLGNVERIRDRLLSHGRAPTTPAAVIIAGTTPHQEVLQGRLGELPEVVAHRRGTSPALVLIGEAVAAGTSVPAALAPSRSRSYSPAFPA